MDITACSTISANVVSFLALGPIPTAQRLTLLNIRIDNTLFQLIPVAAVICGSPALTQANLDSGLSLIATSNTLIARVPAIPFFPLTKSSVAWAITLDRIIESGPRWILLGVFNASAVTAMHLSANLVTSNAPQPFGPGTTGPTGPPPGDAPPGGAAIVGPPGQPPGTFPSP